MTQWTEGWNGNDVAAPNRDAIQNAINWLPRRYKQLLLAQMKWHEPNVSATEEGDVVLEWWHNDKALGIYITPTSTYYIKEWGANIFSEMDDGSPVTEETFLRLWHWLRS